MFLANAKSNFGVIIWQFYGIFRIFWRDGVFSNACKSALKDKICALQIGTVPFRIRKAFVYLRHSKKHIFKSDRPSDPKGPQTKVQLCWYTSCQTLGLRMGFR